MTTEDQRWTRADWARWFVEHDDVSEAAAVLEPGDELVLGHSDYLDLAAALARRGLAAAHADHRVTVLRAPDGARRPPLRATPPAMAAEGVKKTG